MKVPLNQSEIPWVVGWFLLMSEDVWGWIRPIFCVLLFEFAWVFFFFFLMTSGWIHHLIYLSVKNGWELDSGNHFSMGNPFKMEGFNGKNIYKLWYSSLFQLFFFKLILILPETATKTFWDCIGIGGCFFGAFQSALRSIVQGLVRDDIVDSSELIQLGARDVPPMFFWESNGIF